MEIRKFNAKELANYLIVNNSGSNRSGFWHESVLFLDNGEIARHRCQYYNRTWEYYRFQTSMRCAVSDAREKWEKYYLDIFKEEHGYNKLTAKRKEEFEEYLKNQKEIILYNKMYKELEYMI